MQQLGLEPALPDLTRLPRGAWVIRFPFILRTPYISRDDQTFHLLDNPLKKEWVFKVPYVAAPGWKGALRATMRRMRGYDAPDQEANDRQMVRLFGNVRGEEVTFAAGSLHFFPTFFDRLGLEVINPHDRVKGVGERGPILFECAPVGAQGTFTLLYVSLGVQVDGAEIADDLVAVASGIHRMLVEDGFGAKTSSGFGTAEKTLPDEGQLAIAADPQQSREQRTFPSLTELVKQATLQDAR